jgi:hypothetical protein
MIIENEVYKIPEINILEKKLNAINMKMVYSKGMVNILMQGEQI